MFRSSSFSALSECSADRFFRSAGIADLPDKTAGRVFRSRVCTDFQRRTTDPTNEGPRYPCLPIALDHRAAAATRQSAHNASFTSKETGLLTRDLSSWTPPP
jgi:hypothetical protein